MISLLVAVDLNRVIGVDNKMPWHIPEELKYFKEVTMGKAIVMGRKTYESIGRPLPGRLNIIITRNEGYSVEGAEVLHDLNAAIERGKEYSEEVVIIGGAEIFNLSMPMADRLYITVIRNSYEGDTFFPEYNDGNWKLISESEDHHTAEGIPYSYLIYDRAK
ncbi:dihydrofolate reductase [Sporosarcina thermotolerans]|uniref:Dihydrofolate reductase n=1 Tax=Sporosarcina thermotolerans TaxID=633404 RepID=A0AAW9A3Y7_9BACL|nr:dihydrofolate reductase [Sporosarcina thermotolerans]MDW0115419.1 dihydrofolate reductase [Sporosarcina thermotolerans]WHT47252.1 dihydrofolate reductase [Sporosarcina thermotolerans]